MIKDGSYGDCEGIVGSSFKDKIGVVLKHSPSATTVSTRRLMRSSEWVCNPSMNLQIARLSGAPLCFLLFFFSCSGYPYRCHFCWAAFSLVCALFLPRHERNPEHGCSSSLTR